MYRNVLIDQNDHAALKAVAERNHERFCDVQERAVARFVDKYAHARDDLLVSAIHAEVREPAWQGWFVPSGTWSGFTRLRTWSGLPTGVLLQEAVRLELMHEGALGNIDVQLVSA